MNRWCAILAGVVIGGTVAACGSGPHGGSSPAAPAGSATSQAAGGQPSGRSSAAGDSGSAAIVYLQSSAPVAFTGDTVALTIQESAGTGATQWTRLASATVNLGDGTTASVSGQCTGKSLPAPRAGLVIRHVYRQVGALTARVTAVSGCASQAHPDLAGATAAIRLLRAAPAATASWPQCGTSQMRVTATSKGAALGHVGVLFTLQNTSASGCRLFGYPGVQLLGNNGEALRTTVVRATSGAYLFPGVVPHWVALAHGAVSSFDLQYGDNPVGAEANEPYATACPPAQAVEVTPPGAADHTVVPASMAPCGGQVLVSPVVPGSQWLVP